jgi:hypothetical protein
MTHAHTHTFYLSLTVVYSSAWWIGPSQKPSPDNTKYSQVTDPCLRRGSKSQSQQASGCRPMPEIRLNYFFLSVNSHCRKKKIVHHAYISLPTLRCSCGNPGCVFRGNTEYELTSVVNEGVTEVALPNYDSFEARGCTCFPKIQERFRNSRHQKCDVKQFPYWGLKVV